MAPLKSAFLDSTEALEMIPLGIIVAVWLILFGFGIARIVYDDHQGLVGTVSQLKSTNAGLTTDNGELSEQNKKLKKSGRVQPQDLPLKITVLQYGAWDYTLNGQKGTAYFVLAITNRTISPVHVTMMCDKDFVKFDAGLLVTRNNPIVSVGPGHISQPTSRSYEYATQSPPWTPESPLGFGIFTDSKNLKCDVVQNP